MTAAVATLESGAFARMLPLLVVLTAAGVIVQYLSAGPVALLASAGAALVAVALAFAVVWRQRAGGTPLVAAVLILVNLVVVLRALVTPR